MAQQYINYLLLFSHVHTSLVDITDNLFKCNASEMASLNIPFCKLERIMKDLDDENVNYISWIKVLSRRKHIKSNVENTDNIKTELN